MYPHSTADTIERLHLKRLFKSHRSIGQITPFRLPFLMNRVIIEPSLIASQRLPIVSFLCTSGPDSERGRVNYQYPAFCFDIFETGCDIMRFSIIDPIFSDRIRRRSRVGYAAGRRDIYGEVFRKTVYKDVSLSCQRLTVVQLAGALSDQPDFSSINVVIYLIHCVFKNTIILCSYPAFHNRIVINLSEEEGIKIVSSKGHAFRLLIGITIACLVPDFKLLPRFYSYLSYTSVYTRECYTGAALKEHDIGRT